jgi:hypothetical protein
MNLYFPEQVKIVPGLAHLTGGSARTADRVSLENYQRVAILVAIYQAAVNTTAITVDKVTAASSGTESTGITMSNWWKCEDVTPGTTADTWTKGTAAASITSSATGSGTSYYLIDIGADELPALGVDYDFVECELGVSNVGNYVWVTYFLYNPRYAGATLLSAQA